jgi:hypothetical protein
MQAVAYVDETLGLDPLFETALQSAIPAGKSGWYRVEITVIAASMIERWPPRRVGIARISKALQGVFEVLRVVLVIDGRDALIVETGR